MGDLNVHVDDSANRFTMWLNDIMSMYVLRQHVSGSTHRVGHTLDLVINAEDIAVQPVRLHDVGSLSDHKPDFRPAVIRRQGHEEWSAVHIQGLVVVRSSGVRY